MLWHDQTKVGNYDAAIRIPEHLHELLIERQRKTVALFVARHNRQPSHTERARMALFPTNIRNPDGRRPLSYNWFHRAFKLWIDDLDIGRWVPHQARHSLATSLQMSSVAASASFGRSREHSLPAPQRTGRQTDTERRSRHHVADLGCHHAGCIRCCIEAFSVDAPNDHMMHQRQRPKASTRRDARSAS
jgi:hypothetical protein